MFPKTSRGTTTPEPEEETRSLLHENPPRKETPLPITQILVLLLLQTTEPLTFFSIRPYINRVGLIIFIIYIISNVSHSL